ncbi:hypothetical protein RCH33_2463 [Flavobacterium daejeonense]|nr:hypothetical protein RCH33_2463 [Flavobacterium daejeonense]
MFLDLFFFKETVVLTQKNHKFWQHFQKAVFKFLLRNGFY